MHGPLIIFLRFKWILENMSVLSFEANATTITAEGQLYLCVFLTQREQSLSRAWNQHPGWVGRVREVPVSPVLGQKCTWSQEHLLQTPINPTGGYLVHIVVPSHARVAKCLVEGHWEVQGVEASTREVFKQILWGYPGR